MSGFLLFWATDSFAQKLLGLEAEKWVSELHRNKLSEPNGLGRLTQLLLEADSLHAARVLDTLETEGQTRGYIYRTYFCMTKADYLYKRFAGIVTFRDLTTQPPAALKAEIIQLHKDAVNAAYHTEQQLMIGWASFYSARIMRNLGEIGWAVMYAKNGVDLFEKVGYDVEPTVYTWLSELLYDIREYKESFANARKALVSWAKIKKEEDENKIKDKDKDKLLMHYHVRACNMRALNHFTLRQFDSAHFFLDSALQVARHIQDTAWTSKVMVNIGRVLYHTSQPDSALGLFERAYQYSLSARQYDNAAHAAEWAAKTQLAMGNTSTALAKARNALYLLSLVPNRPFLRDSYSTLSVVLRQAKIYDSAFYYNDRFMALNDSLEKAIATSSLAISKARLNDEESRFNIQKLNREKRTTLLWRNFTIAFIILVAVLAVLVVNRRLLKEKIKRNKVEQEKMLLAQNIEAATAQIQLFTANLLEKSHLIEQLQAQMLGQNQDSLKDQEAIQANLGGLTILTEKDWQEFKMLFEKAYPGFFSSLTERFTGITIAEQRMAALIHLALTTHQMASILGISTDSVRKSRQRLRQRFKVSNDTQLNEMIAQM